MNLSSFQDVPIINRNNWHRVKLDHLVFPPSCVSCNGPAKEYETLMSGQINWPLFIFTLGILSAVEEVRVFVPVCKDCLRRARWSGRRKGLYVGLFIAALLAGVFLFIEEARRLNPYLWVPMFLGIGALFGTIAGGGMSGTLPVRIRRYSRYDRSLMIRFDRPEYEQLFLTALFQGPNRMHVPRPETKVRTFGLDGLSG